MTIEFFMIKYGMQTTHMCSHHRNIGINASTTSRQFDGPMANSLSTPVELQYDELPKL